MHNPLSLLPIAQAICQHERLTNPTDAGHGAFKQTFHVENQTGDALALKVYTSDSRSERENREIEAMEKCNHPNIARFLKLDRITLNSKEYLYTIEEFIGGGTLTQRLSQGLMSPHEVQLLGIKLIDAISHIEKQQLVHRDLKPDNILFRSNSNEPVVVDFGLVRDLNETSLTGTWNIRGPGTPYYAAPEQLNNEKPMQSWRTDQFALGITLSICAFGEHPYGQNTNRAQTVDAVASRKTPTPSFIAKANSSGLTALIKMVEPFPIRRYNTPAALAKAWGEQKVS